MFWCGGTGAGAAGCPTRPASTLGTTTDIPVGLKFRLDSNCVYIAWVILIVLSQATAVLARTTFGTMWGGVVISLLKIHLITLLSRSSKTH